MRFQKQFTHHNRNTAVHEIINICVCKIRMSLIPKIPIIHTIIHDFHSKIRDSFTMKAGAQWRIYEGIQEVCSQVSVILCKYIFILHFKYTDSDELCRLKPLYFIA